MTETLKPCPFCGSKKLDFHGMDGPSHEWHFISCDDCDASIGLHVGGIGDPNEDQLTELSKKWNTRINEVPELHKRIAELEAELAKMDDFKSKYPSLAGYVSFVPPPYDFDDGD